MLGTAAIKVAGNGPANVIVGNGAANDLMGLAGNDTLTGGGGADIFVFNAMLNAATNVDTITDFSVVDDTIRLENAFMPGLATGTLAAGRVPHRGDGGRCLRPHHLRRRYRRSLL